MKVIINGDDFGASEDINEAIMRSFEMGIISSATIMANMPGFEEACRLVRENNLFDNVGVHLNLTKGMPLTDNIRRISRFCDNKGQFYFSREKPLFRLKPEEKKAVYDELESQIIRCRQNGIPLTHADSHQHIHTEWAIGFIVMELAKRYNIPYLRITRNVGVGITLTKKLYKWIYNARIRIAGLARTQYFGTLEDLIYFKQNNKKQNVSFEIMVHPVLNNKKEIVDSKNMRILLSQKIKESINMASVVYSSSRNDFSVG